MERAKFHREMEGIPHDSRLLSRIVQCSVVNVIHFPFSSISYIAASVFPLKGTERNGKEIGRVDESRIEGLAE